MKRGPLLKDLTGQIFGSLKVLELTSDVIHNFRVWKCQCECGVIILVNAGYLKHGSVKACDECTKYKRINNTNVLLSTQGHAGKQVVIRTYRKNAKKAKREWKLSADQVTQLFESECFYCGNPPSNVAYLTFKNQSIMSKNNSKYIYNGIDRVNNKLGYTFDNCVSCCKICNIAKHNLTQKQFFDLIKQIANKHSLA